MKQEMLVSENEYCNSGIEFSQAEEIYQGEQEEIFVSRCEFSSESMEQRDSLKNQDEQQKEREKKEKLHKNLISKMSYTVACAAAVLMIAQTAGIGTIEENVVAAGGSINADMRFTLQWNDGTMNVDDLDAHCIQPDGFEIYFESPVSSTGSLDVDIIHPESNVAIENIVYEDISVMKEGTYQVFVHCYSDNPGGNGFKTQIQIDGEIFNYTFSQRLNRGDIVKIAEITLENGKFTLKELMEKVTYSGY